MDLPGTLLQMLEGRLGLLVRGEEQPSFIPQTGASAGKFTQARPALRVRELIRVGPSVHDVRRFRGWRFQVVSGHLIGLGRVETA